MNNRGTCPKESRITKLPKPEKRAFYSNLVDVVSAVSADIWDQQETFVEFSRLPLFSDEDNLAEVPNLISAQREKITSADRHIGGTESYASLCLSSQELEECDKDMERILFPSIFSTVDMGSSGARNEDEELEPKSYKWPPRLMYKRSI